MYHLTWVEINKKALICNYRSIIENLSDDVTPMCVLKSNAYGHGIYEIARILSDINAPMIAIQSVYEIDKVRKAGFQGRVFMIGPFTDTDIPYLVSESVEVTVASTAQYHMILSYLENHLDQQISVHVEIETGLHRQGLSIGEAQGIISSMYHHSRIYVRAICTHLASIEDPSDLDFSKEQLQKINNLQDILKGDGIELPVHIANSGASLRYPYFHKSYVRIGIALYGMNPFMDKCNEIPLVPVLSWFTRITSLQKINPGDSVGYGRTFVAERPMQIATLPIGYYDGYDRLLRSGVVALAQKRAPITGTICMNMCMCDVSAISVNLGDIVEIIGDTIGADELATYAQTINYEMITRINERIPRIIVET